MSRPASQAPAAAFLALVPLAGWLLALSQLSSSSDLSPENLALAALAALFCEMTAVRRLPAQSLSPVYAVYLGAALSSGIGWAQAALLLAMVTALRELFARRASFLDSLVAAVDSALPATSSLSVLAISGNLPLAAVVYLITPFIIAGPLGLQQTSLQRSARRKVLPLQAASVGLGAIAHSGAVAGALVLAGLAYAFHKVVQEADAADRHLLSLKLSKADSQVENLGQQLSRAKTALAETDGDKDLLQQTSAAFPGTLKVEETSARIITLARGLLAARSIVLFLERDGELEIARAISPDQARNQPGQSVGEPAVDRCWREARTVLLLAEAGRKRLFPGDQASVALPLAGLGVLYLGGAKEIFSKKELPRLKLLARQAALALVVAQHNEHRDLALAGVSKARQNLERWVQRLDRLLVAGQRLGKETTQEGVLAHLCRILEDLTSHDRLVCLSASGELLIGQPLEHAERARSVAVEMLRFGNPALVERPSDDEATLLPASGMVSMLAAPLLVEDKPVALIFLFSGEEAAFTTEHRHLLLVLLAQCGVILRNLRLKDELAQGTKMAAIGGMAAGLAHELNNPFGAVQLSLDMLATRVSDDKSAARIDSANRALERARSVVSKLQYYTKFQPERESRALDLNELITRVAGELSYMLDGVDMQWQLEARPALLEGNVEELEQVVSNLLTNATDAMVETGQEHRRLVVRTARDGARLLMAVSDNGPGMSKQVMARATEPFFTTKPPGKGTGLGLSLCDRIVAQHGGTLTIGRSSDGGALVTVELAAQPG